MLTKTERMEVAVELTIATRALTVVQQIYRRRPREGADLDQLKLVEAAVQNIELLQTYLRDGYLAARQRTRRGGGR